jgi:hypothetical protein
MGMIMAQGRVATSDLLQSAVADQPGLIKNENQLNTQGSATSFA